MLLTPTYHVFDLYKEHQDGTLIESYAEISDVGVTEDINVPDLHISASEKDGAIHITLVNLSSSESRKIAMELPGAKADKISARILTGGIHAHNDFSNTNNVKPSEFTGFSRTEQGIDFTIPACSVMGITVGNGSIT
jgi:alpha-N-arabinofuranosidase